MHKIKRYACVALVMLFYFSAIGWMWRDSIAKKNRDAVELYNENKMDEALSRWQDAQIESPDRKELYYNIGNVLHEQKKYEDAYKEYEKALGSKHADFQAKAYYNMGNTNYRMEKLTEAIEDYEKTLKIDPDDEDAKYNIEFVREKLKEKMQKGQDSQQDKVEEQKGNKKLQFQQRETQDKQEAEKTEESKKDSKEEEKEFREKEEISEKSQRQDGQRQDDMSEEDAIRLLDALRDDEKELQRKLRTYPGEGKYKVDRDW